MRAKNILLSAFLVLFAGCAITTKTTKRTGLFENDIARMTQVFEKDIKEGMTTQVITSLGFDPSSPNVERHQGMAALEILRKFKGDRVDFSTEEEGIKRYMVWVFPHVYVTDKKTGFALFSKKKKENGTQTHFVFIFKDGALLQKGMSVSDISTESKESGPGLITPLLFNNALKLAF